MAPRNALCAVRRNPCDALISRAIDVDRRARDESVVVV
jgi:hypothetical protein